MRIVQYGMRACSLKTQHKLNIRFNYPNFTLNVTYKNHVQQGLIVCWYYLGDPFK